MRTKKGTITSAKMQNTVTVTVHRSLVHPLYQKRYRMSKKFLADTNGHDLGVGDEVVITECRPLSKRKNFRVTEILKRAPRVSELVEEAGLAGAMIREKHGPPEKKKTTKNDSSSDQ
ncbi:30S ribosomal protein S17 [Candidatus Peregrinibacteria bacterium]|nr:30S ribosomal protein S17 [Candidatus Peregrinibacteria bacterium]